MAGVMAKKISFISKEDLIKDDGMQQLKESNPKVYKDVLSIYDIIEGKLKVDIDMHIDSILTRIFEPTSIFQAQSSVHIPLSFINSNLGRFIFGSKYSHGVAIMNVTQVLEFINSQSQKQYSRQSIYKWADSGDLKNFSEEASGARYFYKEDVIVFLKQKGVIK